jgi:hypothetical protein
MFGETAGLPLVQKFVPSVTGKKREGFCAEMNSASIYKVE